MSIEYKSYSYGTPEYQKARILRYCILRLGDGISDECVEEVYGDSSQEQSHILLGAFDGELLVGTVNLAPHGEDSLTLCSLAVHDARRGSGIGAELVRFAHETARVRGYRHIRLMARGNVVAFYEKLGYAPTGEVSTHPDITFVEMTTTLA